MASNSISFWRYLKGDGNKIEIPIIQRDYAQGREGKEALRKTFLKSLTDALEGTLPYSKDNPLILDFIYGTRVKTISGKKEKQTTWPLDGQQRLTTLWLLHWYVALHAGKLEEAKKTLSNFTYETRISSREFFNHLTNPENFKGFKFGDNVREYIENQTWFYKDWNNDPTIRASLRMIRGYSEDESKADKKSRPEIIRKNNTVDGLVKLFLGKTKEQFLQYWEALISDEAPIRFYQLPLDKFGLTDDLYIKMNARGKELTFFENFKADLVGYMYQRAARDSDIKVPGETADDWNDLLDPKCGVPIKLDTEWTKIFWKFKQAVLDKTDSSILEDFKIDEIFYAFINRIFWNYLFMATDSQKDYILDLREEKDQTNTTYASYVHLNERDGNRDNPVPRYESIDQYKFFPITVKSDSPDAESSESKTVMTIPIGVFNSLTTVLDRYPQIDSDGLKHMKGPWENDFDFIPRYSTDDTKAEITTLTQLQRIVFFAVCKYLMEGDYEPISFKRWIRVVYNLISGYERDTNGRVNNQIRSIQAMRNAMEVLDSLESHSVYDSLCRLNVKGNRALDIRVMEEVEKAAQILDGKDKDWERLIIEAEQWSFFRGTIHFLFRNADNKPAWDLFETKFKTVKELFAQNAKPDELDALAPSLDYGSNNELSRTFPMRDLFALFDPNNPQQRAQIWGSQVRFNNWATSWMYYLTNSVLATLVHKFLMKEYIIPPANVSRNDIWPYTFYLLTRPEFLRYLQTDLSEAWYRDSGGYREFFKPYNPSQGVWIDYFDRDDFLLGTPGIECPARIEGTSLFHGRDIDFSYNGNYFVWWRNGLIYIRPGECQPCLIKDANAQEEEKRYYCFSTHGLSSSQILEGLRNLIEESGAAFPAAQGFS